MSGRLDSPGLLEVEQSLASRASSVPALLSDLAARYLWRYGRGMRVDAIRAAYEAANSGDVEPLVSLIDAQMEWRGRRRLPWFWRPPPS
jgi:hypothetical protein